MCQPNKTRDVTRFFVTGAGGWGHYRECRRHEPCKGVWGYPRPENVQVWRFRNAIFSNCHEICLRKLHLGHENGKQLQVTVITITESKENNFIHRRDVSGSTGSGGAAAPFPPASYDSENSRPYRQGYKSNIARGYTQITRAS